MVTCKDEEQQRKAIRINKINGKGVKCSVVFDKKLVRGVISGIPLRESVDDVKGSINNAKVKEAKRLKTRRDCVITDSLSIVITFEEDKLPERVFVGYMSYEVKMYIPPPLRCFKCQKYGHVAAVCKGKQRCSRCSGEHEYGKCDKDAKLKCSNCGGEHSSAYRGCEVSKRMQEVQRLKVNQGLSYAEATKTVKRAVVGPASNVKEGRQCTKCDKIKEETLIVSKNNFVLFMTIYEIVNCSAQTTSRTERIKIIVRSADRFLDVKELLWESVRDTLNEEVQQSQGWVGSG